MRQRVVQRDRLPFVSAERLVERCVEVLAELFARAGRQAVSKVVAEREILEAERLPDAGAHRLQQILRELLAEKTARDAARVDSAAACGFDPGHGAERLRVDEQAEDLFLVVTRPRGEIEVEVRRGAG